MVSPFTYFVASVPNWAPIAAPESMTIAATISTLALAAYVKAPYAPVIITSNRSVPTATIVGHPITYTREGILIKPPPTPRKPARKPVNNATKPTTQRDIIIPDVLRVIIG